MDLQQVLAAVAAWKWGYEYLQSRMESLSRNGWAHDCDEEIQYRISSATSAEKPKLVEASGARADRFSQEQAVLMWKEAAAPSADGAGFDAAIHALVNAVAKKTADELAGNATAAATPAAKWREKGEVDPHGTSYDIERAQLALGHLSDDELANSVFLQGGDRSSELLAGRARMPIIYLIAGKERIRWLSRALVKSTELNNQLSAKHRALEDIVSIAANNLGEIASAMPSEELAAQVTSEADRLFSLIGGEERCSTESPTAERGKQ